MNLRPATPADAAALAAIYNQGIEERIATFETALRSDDDIVAWFDGVHPIVVVTDETGEVIAFARASEYSPRDCYGGIFEFAVYTDFAHRRRGAGRLAMRELVTQARTAGAWKLVSRIFVDNEPSRMLVASLGFREVGVHHRHAKLDGRWRDVVVVEKFLAPITIESSVPPAPSRTPREQTLRLLRSPDAAARLSALDSARSLINTYRTADADLLDAVADAWLSRGGLSDATTRARLVEILRAYSSLSRDAARSVDEALFSRLGRMAVSPELDAFYEASFVVKQVVVTGGASRAADLAPYRPAVLAWVREVIALPRTLRSRISPGNLASLLMALALAACETEDDKAQVAELAAEAKERHRVELPTSVRPPTMPPPPPPLPPAPVSEKKPRKKRGESRKRVRVKT